jgi:hypothetical protein
MSTPNVLPYSGNANTGLDNSSQFIRDVDPRLFYLEAYKYPLVSILFTMGTDMEKKDDGKFALKGSQIKKQKTVNPKFEHTESEMLKFAFNPTAAVATGDTTISVSTSDDDYFVAGMEVLLTNAAGSREVVRVNSVGTGSLTVTRNIGSTGAISMTTADNMYIMGVVRAEDSLSTTAVQAKSETLYNYVEFLSEPYGVSKIEQATANYHGDPYARKKMEALARMKQKLEIMAWFGVRSMDASTTNPIYHNGGVMYWLQNQFTDVPSLDVGGLLTKQAWDAWLQDALKYNNQQKFVFASSPVLTAVNGFASNQLRPSDVNLSKFGVSITQYQSPFGTVNLIREPLFDEVASMNGSAVCLDLNNISWRYLESNGVNLDLKSYDDIQENDRSARKGEWMVVGGFDIAVGKSHAILSNVQA